MNQGEQIVAALLQGQFRSRYRLMKKYTDVPFIESGNSKMIVVSDADVIRNPVGSQGMIYPTGYDRISQFTFANKKFLLNCIDYLIDDNGLISGTIEFENPNDRWLSGVADRDDESEFFNIWGFNWIRSGSYTNETIGQMSDYNMTDDPNGVFEGVVMQSNIASSPFGSFEWTGGTWAPYRLCAHQNAFPTSGADLSAAILPAFDATSVNSNAHKLNNLPSVSRTREETFKSPWRLRR